MGCIAIKRQICLVTFVLIVIINILTSCSHQVDELDSKPITSSIKSPDFTLQVTAPMNVKAKEEFKVFVKFTYEGKKTKLLQYSGDKINFILYNEEMEVYYESGYPDIANLENVQPGDISQLEESFILEKGKYYLAVRTSSLSLDGISIKGVGNEDYITEDVSPLKLRMEESKITLGPIVIEAY